MRKFFITSDQIFENKIEIIGQDINHIKNVLRLPVGEKILICNNDDSKNYISRISNISNKSVICEILEEISSQNESNVRIDIFQGLPKADKMELIIQKGTELGVYNFYPVIFKRSIVGNADKKIERWQKIAEVASKQSGRDIIPKVHEVIDLKNIINLFSNYDAVLLTYENEDKNSLRNELLKLNEKTSLNIAVIIGPEGGIEQEEVNDLEQNGAKVVSLGKRILRTETVALAVSAIINYELER